LFFPPYISKIYVWIFLWILLAFPIWKA